MGKKKMPNKMSKEEWTAKEARELLCKTVNSMIMTYEPENIDKAVQEYLKVGKKVVGFAFNNFNKAHFSEDEEAREEFDFLDES